MAFHARHRWIIGKINEGLGLNDEAFVERSLKDAETLDLMNRFFTAAGPDRLLFFFQSPQESPDGQVEDSEERRTNSGRESTSTDSPEVGMLGSISRGSEKSSIEEAESSSAIVIPGKDRGNKQLFATDGNSIPLLGHCVYFFRVREAGREKKDLDPAVAGDAALSFGTVTSELLSSYESVLRKTFKPLIEGKASWQKASAKESREFCSCLTKFVDNVQENLSSLTAALELAKPKAQMLEAATASSRIAHDVLLHFVELLASWCEGVEACLDEDDQAKWNTDDKGPYTELEYWRRRTQRLASITEQLKGKECRTVISVLQSLTKSSQVGKLAISAGAGVSGAMQAFGANAGGAATGVSGELQMQNVVVLLRRWRQIDINITEASNEAKDNVKYLATLEKFIDPLYNGSPATIVDALPALMNSIKMIHTIARYYNTTERMTGLFMKISNQMIVNCKAYLTDPSRGATGVSSLAKAGEQKENDSEMKDHKASTWGRSSARSKKNGSGKNNSEPVDSVNAIWEQETDRLLHALEGCLRLNEAYQEQYHITKDKLLTMPKGRQFDFSETQIFGKMDLFCRRIIKLIDMFSTIHQFKTLGQHQLEGMEGLIGQFNTIVDDFRIKEHDLLDFYNNKFDRDYIQFNVRINDLEASLQQFINRSFESITSIEASLTLLKKFQSILQRDSLRADLDSKFTVIFHNYGLDLTTVQDLYEAHKHSPPISRNMPPVAGSIMWARHLLRRIEEPMHKFEMNQNVLLTKDSKKIIKMYNKVAKTLVAFEYLWYEAWCSAVEKARTGLSATLIIRHPQTKKLYVNFDAEILQLIREAKCLSRMGIDIPSSAEMVRLQENKFKRYYHDLSHMLGEYDRVDSLILPVARQLLEPHMRDLDLTLRAGMVTLTWTSMNIDNYCNSVYAALHRFEELVINLNDIIENRIEKNLKIVGKAALVDLPTDGLLTLDDFVQMQERFVQSQIKLLDAKNVEIESAVQDVLRLVKSYSFQFKPQNDSTVVSDSQAEEDAQEESNAQEHDYFVAHYNRMMYRGLLQATKNSLAAIKKRVCAKGSTGFLYLVKPFFEVDVQLSVPSVRLVPSLDEVQSCINKAAQSILWATKRVWEWGQLDIKLEENIHTGYCNKVSFFERIGQDVQIVRAVLLLTGALLGTQNHVRDFLSGFTGYDWLWKEDMEYQYKRFIDKNPSIEDFEAELCRFVAVENKICQIASVHNIGALSLNTNNLKLQLQSEASQWKVQYSDKVHQQAYDAMENLLEYMRFTRQRVGREVDGLDSLRYVMNVLKEVRERESTIEQEITPILDMYDMLDHYLPPGVVKKEEMDKKSIIRSSWAKLGDFAEEVTDELAGIQGRFKEELIRDIKSFALDVASFRSSYIANGPMVVGLKPKEAVERLRRFKNEYEVREHKHELLAAGEELFALKPMEYPDLVKTRKELNLLDQLYGLYIDVVDTMEQYRNQAWTECVKSIDGMSDKVSEFEARCKRLPAKLRDWDAYNDLRHDLTDFQNILPLLIELSKPSIKNRHWAAVTHMTGINFSTETGKLRELWQQTMLNHKEEIEEICHGADKELEIEEKMSAIKEKWAAEHFRFARWRQRDTHVLKGFGQVIEDLEESQLSCQGMLSMRNVMPFKEEVSNILATLSETGETLERWVKVQMLWMSLESVFMGGDIARQMPQDAKKFAKIDLNFSRVMERAQESLGNVVSCCANELLKNTLPLLHTELERCQKSLEGYLEQKRSRFPRFYFVSNPVLLQILSQGSDVQSVQPYYEKIFDAISQVTHDEEDARCITEMKNILGDDQEVVPFANPVQASGHIEDWLLALEHEMQNTMKVICREAAAECQRGDLLDFIEDFTAQFALLGLQFAWTAQVTDALAACKTNKAAMSECNKKQISILSQLSSLCLTDLGNKMNRKKVETLVTIQVHQRDVFAELLRLYKDRKLSSAKDFDWLKQARFSWDAEGADTLGGDGRCKVSVCDNDFDYAYEYLGCKERLVITPLTDRCYVTLTQALGMHLGGAPAGPAGTGKTETVKDLGRSLGLYVVVTNCTDQQRYTDMAKIFRGLCQAGIWGCFDEFNRIELPVLSVVAQQVLAITNAKRTQSQTLTFPGDPGTISLNASVGLFITMNPGYAGRQELPENLKALFRSVAMMVPDREMIIRVKLCSVGYQKFSELAKKFNALYRCCEEQLSKQKHYDFGLRNILSVLRTAGQTKRDNQDKDERLLVMRTLRDMNLSKFVAQDAPLFLSLLQDLFPSVAEECKAEDSVDIAATAAAAEAAFAGNVDRSFSSYLSETIEMMGLQSHPRWVQKINQVRDTAAVRHGLMIIGPGGSGKSKCLETLTEAESKFTGVGNKIVKLNPKAVRASELFGETDLVSQEWIEGIFAALWQKYNDRSRRDNVWIVCDGPVDAIWIENLNTVLDDNKILTLANGDRIPMTENVHLVFEAEDLNNASPATVSRAGIIYMSETDLDWAPVLESWVCCQQEAHRPILRDLFQRLVTECTLFSSFYRLFTPVVNCTRTSLIVSLFELLEQLMGQARLSDSPSDVELELEKLFMFSLMWTFGGLLEAYERKKFDKFLRSLSVKPGGLPKLSGGNSDSKTAAGEDTCFCYHLALPDTTWVRWEPPEWKQLPQSLTTEYFRRDFASILVPTSESQRTSYVLEQLHARKKPILVVGAPGTAKTSSVLMFSEQVKTSRGTSAAASSQPMLFKKVQLSFATTPSNLQEALEAEVDKRGGKTYGPPGGAGMTVFLDDMSMPETNKWGDQPTLELFRQLLETRSMAFLDKDKRGDFKLIEDVQYIAAMNHRMAASSGKKSEKSGTDTDADGDGVTDTEQQGGSTMSSGIPSRLLRHFFVFNVITPDQAGINEIYGKMISEFYSTAPKAVFDSMKKVIANTEKLLPATINLWNRVKATLLPTPSKFHYTFTMRDLSRVFQGLVRSPFEVLKTSDKTVFQLWRHEVDRVFADKLVSDADKSKFASLVDDVAQKDLGKDVTSCFYFPSENSGSSSGNGKKAGKRSPSKASISMKEDASSTDALVQSSAKEIIPFVEFLQEDEYDEDGVLVKDAPRVYEPAKSMVQLFDRVTLALAQHNVEHPARAMECVLFRDVLHHVLRCVRVLGLPRGNLLLLGVGGSGKQSVTKIATFIVKHELFQIKLSKVYNLAALLDDMRALFRRVGRDRAPVTFLLTEAEIRDESFLQVFNSFLTSGEVTGLFPKDEFAVMASETRPFFLQERPGAPDTSENLCQYFTEVIRNNLHIVLCMSPISPKYLSRARRFPGLFSSTCVNWFLPWPKEALQAVARNSLNDFTLDCSPNVRTSLVSHMGEVHSVAVLVSEQYFKKMRKRVYQTPKSFLAFLAQFKEMYQKQLEGLETKEARVELGLKKLDKGAQDVEQMKVLLAAEEVKLKEAEESCNAMLGSLEQSSMEAKKEASAVNTIKTSCELEAAQITEEKDAAAKELAAAKPFLDEAEKAVNSIKPNDLNELKKLPKPNDIIKLTFDGVMILRMFKLAPVSVNSVSLGAGKEKKKFDFLHDSYSMCQKSMLADSGFLKALFRFSEAEKNNINDETIELLMPYLSLEGFTPTVARNASQACEGLCSWVIAMVKYHAASKVVKPKLEKLGLAEDKLDAALQQLDAAEKNLQKCKSKLELLQDKFQAEMNNKQRIEAGTLASKRKMEQATALIEGLKDERERWTADGKLFAETKKKLVGNCALASAFLCYCGPFNQEFRSELVEQSLFQDLIKRKIPVSVSSSGKDSSLEGGEEVAGKHFRAPDLVPFLSDPITVGEWALQTLPTDPLSIQNGILVTRNSRSPLLIDPQGQGLRWIRNKEKNRMPWFGTTTFDHPRFRDQLEMCMSEGLSLIVTLNSEDEIDSMLMDPVLEKQVVTRAKAKYITIADRPCEFSDDFQVFLVSRLSCPTFSPELQAKTALVDFTVTAKGLEDQLLGHVIKTEQRALEDQLNDVLESVTLNTRTLHDLNVELLQRLTENTGNLLDDTELIAVLASTKRAAKQVVEELRVADETKENINEKREQYRAVAARGAVLYFTIVDLGTINHMYQTSLDQFMRLFYQSMRDAEKSNSVPRRVASVTSKLTHLTHEYVSMGLYERDRLTFVLLLMLRILVDAGHLNPDTVRVFLRAGAEYNAKSLPPKPVPWLPDSAYANAHALSHSLGFFRNLLSNIVEKEPLWRRWFEDNAPERANVPDFEQKFMGELGPFLRLILVRCLREDRTAVAVKDFINNSHEVQCYGGMQPGLGPDFVAPSAVGIEQVFNNMAPDTPAIYLLSSGADPTASVEAYCKKNKHRCVSISMGEGQDKVALKALSSAISNGECVLLQNCHLDLKFMEKVDEILDRISTSLAVRAAAEEAANSSGNADAYNQLRSVSHEDDAVHDSATAAAGSDDASSRNNNAASAAAAAAAAAAQQSGGGKKVNRHLQQQQQANAQAAVAAQHKAQQQQQQIIEVNPKFRLVITTAECDFSVSMLQRSRKVTNEPPSGLKAGILGSYLEEIDQERIDRVESELWRRSLFVCCFLHAVVQERRRYGSLGWTIPYEFNDTDLDASLTFLEKHLFNTSEPSWPAVQYMIGEVHYGGRVTADMDRVTLATFVESWLQPSAMVQGFTFNPDKVIEQSASASFVYDIPDFTELDQYVQHVKSFPDNAAAEILGLHPNANVNVRIMESRLLLDSVVETQPKDAASADNESGGREGAVLAKCAELLSKLPKRLSHTSVVEAIGKIGGLGVPTNIVLLQEYSYIRRVIAHIETCLKALVQAINGEIVLTNELSDCLDAIYLARVPQSWIFSVGGDEISWRSSSLALWTEGMKKRVAQLAGWVSSGRPHCFWLSGFSNPSGFLTASKQEAVRAHTDDGWSLDSVIIQTQVTSLKDASQARSAPREGVYVSGLVLEGAAWHDGESSLMESKPKELFTNLPVLHVTAVAPGKRSSADNGPFGGYECPVFRYPNRQEQIMTVTLPTRDAKPSHWRMRSAALLLNKDA